MKKLILALIVVGIATGCGGDEHKDLFTPRPECKGDPVTPLAGTHTQIITKLSLGAKTDGFDFNGDGTPDNKFGGVSSLVQPAIDKSLMNFDILAPIEFFDMPAVAADSCVKFAVYLGKAAADEDGDTKSTLVAGGDCNDHNPDVAPGKMEIAGNFIDDDCDGKADDVGGVASTDTSDHDGDGQTIADGDCDDTNPMVKKGMPEICGDGLDNDCDGVADRSVDGAGNVTACSPYLPTADVTLDPRSFDDQGNAQIAFTNGVIDKSLHLTAGPSVFSIQIPITGGVVLALKITAANIEADVQPDGTLANGKLGGLLDSHTADGIRGLDISEIGLKANQSLLDATYGNILGTFLGLPKAKTSILKKYPDCHTPDIDVDGDGLESFCSTNPNSGLADVCIDGDGTVVMSTYDAQGNIIDHCAQAKDSKGNFRFVDGISVELNFSTSLIHSIKR